MDPKKPSAPTFGGAAANAGDTPRPGTRPPAAPAPVDSPGKTRDFLQSAPKLELPKGGGAIRGIGEKFQANPVSGTASMSVPIAVSPGRNGFGPSLSLSYDSGAGNGPFGLGWSLGVPQIRRKTDKGLPRYRDATDGDTFVLSDAEDLVPFLEWTGTTWAEPSLADASDGTSTWERRRYRPRVEGTFARIERWTEATSRSVHWRTWSRENIRRIYGADPSSRLADPDNANHVFCWYLEEERDERGNLIRYEYEAEDRVDAPATQAEAMRLLPKNQCTYTYLKRILYGNVTPNLATGGWLFEVVFDYGDHSGDPEPIAPTLPTAPPSEPDQAWSTRDDIHSSFKSGFDVRCYRLCARVLVFHRFDDPVGATVDPLLVRSTELAYAASAVATTLTSITQRGWLYDPTAGWSTETMPALEFGYTAAVIDATIQFVDGMDDLPGGLDMSRWQWVDLDGEGLSGLLTEQGGGWFYKRNVGAGELGAARRVESRPSLASLGDGGSRMMDIDGDGRFEVVSLQPRLAGFFGRDPDGTWQGFRSFRTVPNVDWNSPDVRLLDLDGDGLADVMVTEDECITWYPSDGVRGWTDSERVRVPFDEDKGPRALMSTERETIFLADMTGDGLVDIVRVRNHNIAYWPNRGYGRFGAKVQMKGAPWFDAPDRFDPKRVRLVDIDGSGPADLVYLGPANVRIWDNESGNCWSATATTLTQLPGVENSAVISVADLLGDGTACLTWASPLLRDAYAPLRYIHLMAEGKPYLLKTVTNNLGRVTTLTYAPSTQFMVADREAGTPWATRLPFPVQVLESVQVRDDVTGWRNTTTYAYHHGYYDGDEREFRGFGKVEQWDTEALGTFEDSDRGTGAELDLDPVRTVSWFHTGAWRQQGTLESAYADEYWTGDAVAWPTDCTTADVPGASWTAMKAAEKKEAARALKGKLLRQEVYAEDGVSEDPFVVTATTYEVVRVQAKDAGEHASFLVVPRESMARHYERNAADPRSLHTLTLAYDAYGNVTEQATVNYPRRASASPTAEQAALTVLVETHAFVAVTTVMDAATPDPVDPDDLHWHVGVAWENQKWQVTHDSWASYPASSSAPTDQAPFTIARLSDVLGDASDIQFETAPTTGLQKRCFALDRVTFWDDGLSGALADGTMERRALPYQKAQRVLTSGLATSLYGTRVVTGEFEDAGYVDRDGDGHWWGVSGTQVLDVALFYAATSFTDPFGNVTEVDWDAWALLPLKVTQSVMVSGSPVELAVEVTMDQAALQPSSVTDPNGNVTLAAYDALGRLTAVAVRGKTTESLGDTLVAPTVAYTYELHRWAEPTPLPARVIVSSRTEHGGSDFLYRYTYSDGGGNVVQEKVSAEDGEVPGTSGTVSPRWVGTGRTVLNNKGLPIKQYEPFFSASAEYEFEDEVVATGVSSTITYDALGRALRVDLPNGTFRTVAFTPWEQAYSDENDTVLDSAWYTTRQGYSGYATDTSEYHEYEASEQAGDHASTPSTVLLDALGRPYETQELLTASGTAIVTRVTLDLAGNPTEVRDDKGLNATVPYVLQTQTFDLVGRPLRTLTSDAGDTLVLLDLTGQPIALFKSGDLGITHAYDALRRRTTTTVLEGTAGAALDDIVTLGTVREVMQYGEEASATPAVDNLLGKPWRAWDTAGRVESTAYDFKGNLLSSVRQFWDRTTAGTDLVTWAATPSATNLESAGYTVSQTYDALNRLKSQTAPDTTVTANTYNAAGLLETVTVGGTVYVTGIAYNARGQRESIDYGSGVTTAYTYDDDTFRLKTLRSVKTSSGAVLQELTYWYDPVGNITRVNNTGDTGGTLYFANVAVTANQTFIYDALYRLITATGREKTSLGYVQSGDEPAYGNLPDINTAVQAYTQTYSYDSVGNISQLAHDVTGSSSLDWTRDYVYAADSNHLDRIDITNSGGTFSESFTYDERGSIVYLPGMRFSSTLSPNIETDFRDQIVKVHLATSGQYAIYWQDGGGQRVRKLVVKGAVVEERRYVGPYEVWTRNTTTAGAPSERTTLHIMDDTGRIAMREQLTGVAGSPVSPTTTIRYQLGNHLGTACVEVDGGGNVLSYEEYHPYGTTAWQAPELTTVSLKRYRYIGMERDEETGLQRHGMRYYAPWLGRWTATDPIGIGDGVNRYAYAHGNPQNRSDASGLGADENPTITMTGSKRVEIADLYGLTYEDLLAAHAALTAEPYSAPVDKDVWTTILQDKQSPGNHGATLATSIGSAYSYKYTKTQDGYAANVRWEYRVPTDYTVLHYDTPGSGGGFDYLHRPMTLSEHEEGGHLAFYQRFRGELAAVLSGTFEPIPGVQTQASATMPAMLRVTGNVTRDQATAIFSEMAKKIATAQQGYVDSLEGYWQDRIFHPPIPGRGWIGADGEPTDWNSAYDKDGNVKPPPAPPDWASFETERHVP